MANSNNKNTQQKKSQQKSNNQKQPAPQNRRRRVDEEQEELKQARDLEKTRIAGIITFAVSLVFFFVSVIPGQGAWLFIHNAYIGIFGWVAAILLSIAALVYSFLYTVKKPQKNMIFESISIVVIVLMISAFIHVVINQPGADFVTTVKDAFTNAPATFNGGLFGALIGWVLLTMGKAPAIIIDVIVVFALGLLLSRVTINQFFKTTTMPVKKVYEKAAPIIEESIEKRRHKNIDIYLDEKAPCEDNTDQQPVEDVVDNQIPVSSGDATLDIIKEINDTTARNKAQREGVAPVPISVEEKQVKKEQKEQKEQDAPKGVEKFEVPQENMEHSVSNYKLPPIDLLNVAKKTSNRNESDEMRVLGTQLINTLESFGVKAEVTNISKGPTVTRYELRPAAGVRISKITNLSDDIALNLAATHVRIEAPIPGKAAVGIEIPNTVKNMVSMRELIETSEFTEQKSILSAGLGKDIAGNCIYCDVAKMPHLLIAGTTGSGKSVCMNSIIVSILYRAKPEEVKLLMIDPKKVEFSKYENIPHLLVPVVTDPRKASGALGWAVSEMLKRYQTFSDTGVRDIEGYNKYVAKHKDMEPMPKVVICIDELADLMMAAPKEVEDSICRLAQMARAAGMHLVIATQRPSVDVITGLIKANISSRIALTVSSQIDSRTILDSAGAEKLLGYGDMLYAPIGSSKPVRVQGCYISDEEVEKLCEFIKNQGESQYSEEIQKEIEAKAVQDKASSPFTDESDGGEQLDSLFEKAVETVIETGKASTSFLQRKLGVGYSRGSKIMDQLEEKGIIGPQDGSKPRDVRINMQQWLEMKAYDRNGDFTAENTVQMSFAPEDDDVVVDNQDEGFVDINTYLNNEDE